ncbi:hypothetical protein [Umezawaea beigongshangensis]|uniref:hypothetical protein n=1 Tax=Umezawaea beigongshangensis TaxID=2780383 RepID=UPI0018F109E0|nr:hypothetical protein [Umezawaea beigongshangensis]
MSDEQERLLADALRAQATSANVAVPQRTEDDLLPWEPRSPFHVGSGFHTAPSFSPVAGHHAAPRHQPGPARPRLTAGRVLWVLLLAVLLGLAAGGGAALFTLPP